MGLRNLMNKRLKKFSIYVKSKDLLKTYSKIFN